MRRSTTVLAPLLASAAVALLSGCGPEMQRCVDQQNHVVNSSFCQSQPSHATTPIVPGRPFYRYYYGGGGSYSFGSAATGGRFTPESGVNYSTTSGTARGGFGSSFSEGGGHGGEGFGGGE